MTDLINRMIGFSKSLLGIRENSSTDKEWSAAKPEFWEQCRILADLIGDVDSVQRYERMRDFSESYHERRSSS